MTAESTSLQPAPGTHVPGVHASRGISNPILGMILFITSLAYTSVAHGAVIYATIPFLAAFLGWIFLREVPGRNAIIASLFALAGVVLMVGFGADGGLFGDLLAFGMTLCMAFAIILMRRNPGMSAMPGAFICLEPG